MFQLSKKQKGHLLNILSICLVLSSCQISGLTSGFSHLSDVEKSHVIDYTGAIDSISDFSYVYTISGDQVKEYLSTHPKVIIYNYTPFCKSSFCISPLSLIQHCKQRGIDVLIISNIYDDLFAHINSSYPLFMINTKEYKTKWRGKYIEAFYFPLIGHKLKEIDYACFYYFQNGVYVKSFNDFKDINL